MRLSVIVVFMLAGCSQQANHLGNPLLLPLSAFGTAIDNAAYGQRRGNVEVIVKSGFPTIVEDIRAGGGPTLTAAMDAAGIAPKDRPARLIQLQSDIALYQNAPGPLVTALMVYGS